MEPVEIIILPTGKSLDVCAELREAKKVRKVDGVEVLKKKRRKKKKEFKGSTPAEEGVHDMFDFINTKVFAKSKYSLFHRCIGYCNTRSTQDVPKRKNVQLEKSDSANTSNLNLKVRWTVCNIHKCKHGTTCFPALQSSGKYEGN